MSDEKAIEAGDEVVERVRASFARQSMMRTLGAELALVERGRVDIRMPFCAAAAQQNGYLHAPAAGAWFVASGRVVRPGRTITVASAEVFAHQSEGGAGKLIATMTATTIRVDASARPTVAPTQSQGESLTRCSIAEPSALGKLTQSAEGNGLDVVDHERIHFVAHALGPLARAGRLAA